MCVLSIMPYIGNKNSKFSVRPPSPPAQNAFASLQQFVSSYNLTANSTLTHQTVPSVATDPMASINDELNDLRDNMSRMDASIKTVGDNVNEWIKCKEQLQSGLDSAHNQLFVIQSQVATFSDALKQHEEMMATLKRQLAETAEAVIKLQLSGSADDSILSELTNE